MNDIITKYHCGHEPVFTLWNCPACTEALISKLRTELDRVRGDLVEAHKEIAKLKAKPKRVKPATPPRYDEVFYEGMAMFDDTEEEKGE